MNLSLPPAARDSWPDLTLALAAALAVTFLAGPGWLAALSWLTLAWVIHRGREEPRAVPALPGAVLSPADGRVVKIEPAHDPYAQRDAVRISVLMTLFRGHANRASVDGVVRQVHYHPGRCFNASLDSASSDNERNALVIDSHGRVVTLAQIAGFVARRILCHVKPGDTLMRGQRFGFIRLGSRVDIYLPTDAVLNVAPGDKVSATTTILATLPTT
ncbi:phosphatidylserine decarboxylase [Aquabacterium sp.]|uniref:phosphatidylserine decarboxylase n=1 Tax=Aquabacterium sp. TaxID=1872578 RepID=UPI002E30EFFA|nr:phosphatidylserine decarboxylase [Aquabacterium sp.]HEX5312487.1 phosphatidylserine decarboxylase [Aquabacterium sp.]